MQAIDGGAAFRIAVQACPGSLQLAIRRYEDGVLAILVADGERAEQLAAIAVAASLLIGAGDMAAAVKIEPGDAKQGVDEVGGRVIV